YSEDIDLSYLLLKNVFNNYYLPQNTIIHFKGESTLKNINYMKRFKEAMQFFYKKHFKTSVFFNLLMNVGIFLFAFKKKNEKAKPVEKPQVYIYVGENGYVFHCLKKQFSNVEMKIGRASYRE